MEPGPTRHRGVLSGTIGAVTTNWNFADVYEAVAARSPTVPARSRASGSSRGASSTAGPTRWPPTCSPPASATRPRWPAYLYNGPEYLETIRRRVQGGVAPVNTNYRYGPEEILYLFDNADAEAVVFHATFTELLDGIRDRLPKVQALVRRRRRRPATVPTGRRLRGRSSPSGADARPTRRGAARGDDLLLLYTGGTTGMPKGVMWRQDDLFNVLGAGGNAAARHRAGDRRRRARRPHRARPTPAAVDARRPAR